jgi:hypothetical protein
MHSPPTPFRPALSSVPPAGIGRAVSPAGRLRLGPGPAGLPPGRRFGSAGTPAGSGRSGCRLERDDIDPRRETAEIPIRKAFLPDKTRGGTNDKWERLYVDSGILNPELNAARNGP